jgi:hypothetical protein
MLLRRLALAIGLLFGLIGTQGPEFAQQYRQRLAGAIDELSRVVATFTAEAAAQSLTPDEAVERLRNNSDLLARQRGDDVAADMSRLVRLQAALAAFRDSASWKRLAALVEDFDGATARQTWKDFEPAVPTSLEAAVVGALAWFWGWAATHLCAWPIRRHLLKRRGRLSAASV